MSYIDQVVSLVKEAPCNDYRIVSQHQVSYEAYFVKQDVDILRSKELQTCQVEVFVDTKEGENTYRGSADVTLSEAHSIEEMREKIQEACVLASYVKEPYYPLPKGFEENSQSIQSNLKQQLTQIANAIKDCEIKENEVLNSFEIFANETETELLNSQGLHVTYTTCSNYIEIIVNVNREGREVEIYHADTFANKSKEDLQKDIKRILQYGQDKMIASPLDKDIQRVAICNRDVKGFVSYFLYQLNTYSLYAKMSDAKIGQPFFKESCKGDAPTLKVWAKAEGASSNPPCSSEGVKVVDATLLDKGVVRNYVGNNQYGYYLQCDAIPSLHWSLEGGQYSESELKKSPYLECVEFSDFSVDVMSGDFAGEIRLAYYFDGKERIPMSGGSVSGNIKKLCSSMYFSKETNCYDGNILPKSIFIDDVNVAKGV